MQTSDGGRQLTSTAAMCQQQGRRVLEVLTFCRGWRCHRSPKCLVADECASEIAELAREVRGQWQRTGMYQR